MRIAVQGGLAAALALILAGCGIDSPNRPEEEVEEGFILIEGHSEWSTNSVSWKDSATGTSRFAFISVSLEASTDGPSHFLYDAQFRLGCDNDECFPQATRVFVQPRFDISNLDWSPVGPLVAFEGVEDQATWIYTLQPGPDAVPRKWVKGLEPSFFPHANLVVYVEEGRDAIRSFNPSSGGGFVERPELQGVGHPRVSLDGRYIAYSASDSQRGQQIIVHDRINPTFQADPVSDPDRLPTGGPGRDGINDDYPTWSPGGKYIAYRGRVRDGMFFDAIFVTNPHAMLENPVRIAAVSPGRSVTYLRWHRNGQLLLVIIDGDVYVLPVPERYQDRS
jgi:hypothetical protein